MSGPFDRRRRILVNRSEALTDAALRDAASGLGLRVDAKVRIADAVDIERSGLSAEAYRYALRAHLDWVVSNGATTQAEFGVEFDGPSHDAPTARRRDALKDEVCARLGLPLLRVGAAALRPTSRRTVLGVLLEAWEGWRGFVEAQEAGRIAPDEPFDARAFVELDPDTGEIVVPLDLTAPVRRRVARMAARGILAQGWVSTAFRGARGEREWAEGYAWVPTADGREAIGHARVRGYSFRPVDPADLADSLAHLDLGDQLARWREGDDTIPVAASRAARLHPDISTDGGWSGGG